MQIKVAVALCVVIGGCRIATKRIDVPVADTPEGRRCLIEAEASFIRCREVGRKSQCTRLRNQLVEECPKPGNGVPAIKHEPPPKLPGWSPEDSVM